MTNYELKSQGTINQQIICERLYVFFVAVLSAIRNHLIAAAKS